MPESLIMRSVLIGNRIVNVESSTNRVYPLRRKIGNSHAHHSTLDCYGAKHYNVARKQEISIQISGSTDVSNVNNRER
ncbi:hypothetical protein GUJ93_ZPchr0011g27973 [Zizania palustris]|uniref:Uncharacterized protein n=1 Tax=Zizania palustris TaxID=103762 RepID=A0A8J5WMF9_ZIZPA|nr:hypothetical protein GUJ93_ZPchr0011g27973 [Zizania palustris]